ncbi:MAG: hypothetical protein L0287_27570 [Anaerolineae bacterium]|nr:hypothetical protein [Anaerolineae bacterium]
MGKFEDFLIAEFTEQHMSMRQTEASTIQVIQFAFAIEGVVIAGVFSLVSGAKRGTNDEQPA